MEYLEKSFIVFLLIICSFITACDKEKVLLTSNQRFKQSSDWNYQHPFQQIDVQSDDYTIFSMADSHVGGTVNLELFIHKAITAKVSAVVMDGDLTSGKAEDYSEFERHLPDKDTLNYFLIAGNHDLFSDGWPQFYSRFGSSTYLFTVKTPVATDLYVCLETGGSTIGTKQFDWLKNTLESLRPGYRRCIIFTHVNFFRSRHTFSTTPFLEEVATLTAMFLKNNVDMVVTGHDHEHSFETIGKTTFLIMDALVDDFEQAGYLKLTMTSGVINFSFEKL